MEMIVTPKKSASAIAIIGMAGRFPGASNLAAFWRNLRDGVESLSRFSKEELIAAGVDPQIVENPNYVKAGTYLDAADEFDAAFFGVNPREAEVMDPQHRVLLECAWEALEDAACDSESYSGAIGVFAGSSMNTYGINNLLRNPEALAAVGGYQAMIGNDKDFITTRISYKLNLRGPSVAVQTACSTSLVAVQLACQSLLSYQCDIALAGGVSINFPQHTGYLFQEGMIFSPDGHCRPFDSKAQGIRAGEGVGIVVLKRLEEALRDRDNIHAVILGAAINNDGSQKVGYTAPSVDGQAEAIASAQAVAQVEPNTISYIEAHGTATPLGDPIEIAALTKVFRNGSTEKQFCGIGSLKSNVGHLDAAAGVAGLLKTVLALKHKQLPPSLNFESPNPQIDFESSPFYVNTKLVDWNTNRLPRRAGVSSFGIGGTNAHVILEEAPARSSAPPARPNQVVALSAKTGAALEVATLRLAEYLKQDPAATLADVAYSLQTGRRAFDHRKIVVCCDVDDARKALESGDRRRVYTAHQDSSRRHVAFMFSGQGSQYVNMGAGLYRTERVYRECLDECAKLLQPHLGHDLRGDLFLEVDPNRVTKPGQEDPAARLNQTALTQPALFATEYSLAKLWMSWGIEPQAMIGHSIGEYVAACLAGVFSLPDALELVAARGKLMQSLPPGAMLVVPLPEKDARARVKSPLTIAAINAPALCVASGPVKAIDELEAELEKSGVAGQRLRTSHAFHSEMMDPAVKPFVGKVASVKRNPPKIRFISNVTGTWISSSDAVDPEYWGTQLRGAVQFSLGIAELAREPGQIFLEVGPGHTLKTLARQSLPTLPEEFVLSSLPHPHEKQPDETFLLNTLGRLWLAGAPVSWPRLHAESERNRISLPAYPFERRKFWIEPRAAQVVESGNAADLTRRERIDDWFWVNSWQRSVPLSSLRPRLDTAKTGAWAIFLDECGIGEAQAAYLREKGAAVITIAAGAAYARSSAEAYTINPAKRADYDQLVQGILASGKLPRHIVHLWNVSRNAANDGSAARLGEAGDIAFYSPLYFAQAFADLDIHDPMQWLIASSEMQTILGGDGRHPEKALLLGPCKVIPQEHANISCRSVDIELVAGRSENVRAIADLLLGEATNSFDENIVAYRGGYRWVQSVERVRQPPAAEPASYLRQFGVYLITGGTGGIGLTFAKHFAEAAKARLVLTSRSGLPPRSAWSRWIESHDSADGTSDKIRQIRILEDLGSEVIVAAADSADEQQMRAVIAQAIEKFGPIHGVIHAAGLPGGGLIQLKSRDAAETVLSPKVRGTLLLEYLLANEKLDFFVLCSSVNALYGGVGAVDYCAANAFLDAYAAARSAEGRGRIVSINWDAWREVGMAAKMDVPADMKAARQESLLYGIQPNEGIDSLDRILAGSLPQVAVVTRSLSSILDHLKSLISARSSEASRQAIAGATPAAAAAQARKYGRPELANPYVAAHNDQEKALVGIWTELLGIEPVGVHDNFFDLGGHSLLATRVLSRVQEVFKVRLPLRVIFEAPTIAELSERLQTVAWAMQAPVTAGDASNHGREEIDL